MILFRIPIARWMSPDERFLVHAGDGTDKLDDWVGPHGRGSRDYFIKRVKKIRSPAHHTLRGF